MDEAGVDRVVIVPPSWPGDRNDYALEAAKRYPNRFAVMGRIPLEKPKSAELLAEMAGAAGHDGHPADVPARAGGEALTKGTPTGSGPLAEKAGLPVMFFAPGQHPEVRADRRAPSRADADHRPHEPHRRRSRKEGRITRAIDDVVALAKYPNVSVKLSSAPTYSLEAYPWRDMTEHLKRCFDAFGPRRCYWGTDITNAFAKSTYRQRITHFTEELPFLSEEDKDWVMGKAILARLNWA